MPSLRKAELWLSSLLIFVAAILIVGRILNWYSLGFLVGPFRANHWLVLLGAGYIAVATPTFSILKRRYQARYQALVRFHALGNLSAFLLVTSHFAAQVTRSPSAYPELGVGLTLYVVMFLLVSSGFLFRFRLIPRLNVGTTRFVHTGVALSFYILIGIHILHGFGFL